MTVVLDCSADGFASLWTLGMPWEGTDRGYLTTLDVTSADARRLDDAAWRSLAAAIGDPTGVSCAGSAIVTSATGGDEAGPATVEPAA